MLTQVQYELIVDAIKYGLPARYSDLVNALVETIKLAAEANNAKSGSKETEEEK